MQAKKKTLGSFLTLTHSPPSPRSLCLSLGLEALEYNLQWTVLAGQLVCNDFWQQWRQTEEHVCLCMSIYKSTLGNHVPILETLLFASYQEPLHIDAECVELCFWEKWTTGCEKKLASEIPEQSEVLGIKHVSDVLMWFKRYGLGESSCLLHHTEPLAPLNLAVVLVWLISRVGFWFCYALWAPS